MSFLINSRHVRINFFWMDYRVKKVKIIIKHCKTEKILAYFFTKPLQGSNFNFFRRVTMGWDNVATLWDE